MTPAWGKEQKFEFPTLFTDQFSHFNLKTKGVPLV